MKKDFKNFVDEISSNLVDYLKNKDVIIDTNEVVKNNGLKLTGLRIYEKNETLKDDGLMPIIYLNEYYDDYKKNENLKIEDILSDIANTYDATLKKLTKNDDVIKQSVLEKIKPENVICKLVSKSKNEERLANCPHKDYEDMTKEYKVIIYKGNDLLGQVQVTNDNMELLGINNVEELDKIAFKNTERLFPPTVRRMQDILNEMLAEAGEKELIDDFSGPMMYVVSNETGINGAISILNKDFMKSLAEKFDDDLLVLPSSIHECIVLHASDIDLIQAQNMVKEINQTQVQMEERLTDSVYIYDSKEMKLELAYNDTIRDILKDVGKNGVDSEMLNKHYELFNNKSFMRQAIEISHECINLASDRLKADNQLVLAANEGTKQKERLEDEIIR